MADAPDAVVDGALELLLASDRPEVALHLIAAHGAIDVDRIVAVARRARIACDDGDRAVAGDRRLRVIVDADGWTADADAARALADAGAEVQVVRRMPEATLPDLRVLIAAEVPVRVVLQVPVAAVDALPAAAAAAVAAGVDELVVEPLPEGWEEPDAAALGRALWAVASAPAGRTVLRDLSPHRGLHPHRERSGHFGEVLVDRDGAVGRSDGLVPGTGLHASCRLAHLDDLTNVDRHHLELADGRLLSGVPRLEVLRRRRALADRVIASLARWAAARHAPPPAPAA